MFQFQKPKSKSLGKIGRAGTRVMAPCGFPLDEELMELQREKLSLVKTLLGRQICICFTPLFAGCIFTCDK
jgi:hypothetical protein